MRVVIAGGTGLIGRRLVAKLQERGDEPVVLSRDPNRHAQRFARTVAVVRWDPKDGGGLDEVVSGAAAIVNLAGASVGRWPWTEARKRELIASRLASTNALVNALRRADAVARPPVLVNASGTDLYEGIDAVPASEETRPAVTFLAGLCLDWEAAALQAETLGVRVVLTRTSLVVDRDAAALKRFALPVRLFVGGRLGNGQQWVSWIHMTDAVGLILLAIEREDVSGPINVSSPDARRQVDFTRTIGRVLGRPVWLPAPASLIKVVLGEQATLALGSRRVWPARALELGYEFRYIDAESALAAELA